jgi:CubicO group peptidase (beta-lactamase class C family)
MKYILTTFMAISLICACSLFSGRNTSAPIEDSLQFYPPTPVQLDKTEFRRLYRSVSSIMESELLNGNFNGGILVAKDGNIIYEHYKGFTNLKGPDSVTANTPFHIASTSKTFTAVALLQLVQQGKLSLEDSLPKFFPGFPYPAVTVKMLLSHRSGIPNYVYFIPNSKRDKKKMVFNQDVLDFLITQKPNADFVAGKRFAYSNTNFVLLAMIIEKLTGQPFPVYMQQHFFTPLQMNNTFIFTWSDSAKVLQSYTAGGRPWEYDNLEGTYGDKNVFSTPRDLLKWDQALYTEQFINKALLDSAFKPYSLERPSIHNYGLGFRMMLLPTGKKVIYHNGRWHGFNSAFARLTDEKATIIILGNRLSWKIYHTASKCYNCFGPYFPGGNSTEEDTDSLSLGEAKATPRLERAIVSKTRR